MKRRKMLSMIGIGGVASWAGQFVKAQDVSEPEWKNPIYYTFQDMLQDQVLKAGEIVSTLGYYQVSDGGGGQYQINSTEPMEVSTKSRLGMFLMKNGLSAQLVNVRTVNYQIFGAKGDGMSDDGLAIMAAHEFANEKNLPVHNLSGEFWIREVRNIPVETNVNWGHSVFHIAEKYNTSDPVFHIRSRYEPIEISARSHVGKAILDQLNPGVQVISELKEFKNHLIHLYDDQDRIAFRAGNYSKRGRAREELVYVSQEGRILGEVVWSFKSTVNITAYPAEHSYLLIEGGTFYLSGENPVDPPSSYTHNGILVTRSRTRIRRQWAGIEPGSADDSMTAQSGFYYFTKVYDVQMEDIRLIPREKNRPGNERDVPQGTYGIGGNRVLEFSMIGVVAEGTGIHWGVLGTNMMKNVSLKDCRINRFDVHFHLWNLTIRDSKIGHKGITVTGGGKLHIENTTCYQHRFINFRQDYGAKWEGDIYISNCILKPPSGHETTILYFVASDFDYGYPVGMARSIVVKDTVIDYEGYPKNDAPCWLIRTSGFSITSTEERLFFPSSVRFHHVRVKGRDRGVRIVDIKNPSGYQVAQVGAYDGDILQVNSKWELDQISLESMGPDRKPLEPYHLIMETLEKGNHEMDKHSPHFELTVRNCPHFAAYLVGVRIKIKIIESAVNRLIINDSELCEGEALFDQCDFVPLHIGAGSDPAFALNTSLGTTFTNCVIHLPVNGKDILPDQLKEVIPFIDVNNSVKYNHVNTRLSNGFLRFLKDRNIKMKKKFRKQLMLSVGVEKY